MLSRLLFIILIWGASLPFTVKCESDEDFDIFKMGAEYMSKLQSSLTFDIYDNGELLKEIETQKENPDIKLNVVRKFQNTFVISRM